MTKPKILVDRKLQNALRATKFETGDYIWEDPDGPNSNILGHAVELVDTGKSMDRMGNLFRDGP